jgi:hypothetical protein
MLLPFFPGLTKAKISTGRSICLPSSCIKSPHHDPLELQCYTPTLEPRLQGVRLMIQSDPDPVLPIDVNRLQRYIEVELGVGCQVNESHYYRRAETTIGHHLIPLVTACAAYNDLARMARGRDQPRPGEIPLEDNRSNPEELVT